MRSATMRAPRVGTVWARLVASRKNRRPVETRFSTTSIWFARGLLAVVVLLVVLGALLNPSTSPATHFIPKATDAMLYRAIEKRMQQGEGYYESAAAEQRSRAYPTAPAQVFREPTLAWALSVMQTDTVRRTVLVLVSLLTFAALREALVRTAMPKGLRFVAMLLLVADLIVAWGPDSIYGHEIWAGFLIAASLALNRLGLWRLSVVLGVAACLIRELAMPYLVVMGGFALYEHRRREAAGWAIGAALFSAFFAWHLSLAGNLHMAGDRISSGWLHFSGWPFVLEAAKRDTAWVHAPNFAVAAILCAALIGLAGFRDRMLSRAAALVGFYSFAFLFVGRPENAYWGILYAPLLPIGVALSPLSMRDLMHNARLTFAADGGRQS